MDQRATVGRIVHYVLPNGEHRAAVVASESPLALSVAKGKREDFRDSDKKNVLAESSTHVLVGPVDFDEFGKFGTWHWPEWAVSVAAETSETAKEPITAG